MYFGASSRTTATGNPEAQRFSDTPGPSRLSQGRYVMGVGLKNWRNFRDHYLPRHACRIPPCRWAQGADLLPTGRAGRGEDWRRIGERSGANLIHAKERDFRGVSQEPARGRGLAGRLGPVSKLPGIQGV